jgi:elongation factor P hydroxylase
MQKIKLLNRLIFAACALTLLLGVGLSLQAAVGVDNRGAVDVRTISVEVKETLVEQGQAEEEMIASQRQGQQEPSDEMVRQCHGFLWNTNHNATVHRINRLCMRGEENIELGDGSIWSVHPDERDRIAQWHTDHIAIMPHVGWIWFWKQEYKYHLVNERTGECVRANILYGSIIGKHLYITHIDRNCGEVRLSDRSVWVVNDTAILQDWEADDVVLLGSNNSWLTRYPNIILNITAESSFTRARWQQ